VADIPATHYAHNGEVSIAYQTVGEGPFDMMFLPGWISHVEHVWELPALRRFLERLSGFSRLILFDRRGAGLSERISTAPTLQEEVADAIAVLDAAGSERAALLSYALGGPTAIVLARQHPERVGALVLYAAVARTLWAADYNWAPSREWREAIVDQIVEGWGEGRRLAEFAPSAHQDPSFASWFARMERLAASPGVARTMSLAAADIDVRGELEHIRVPTIVMHRPQERVWDVRHSQYLAENIPGARFLPLPGVDSFPWLGDEGLLNEVEEFLTGGRSSGERERTLLTVLFTDIVGATARAAELGDARWRDELAAHDEAIRRVLRRFDGHEVKTIGDSFLATFAGAPSRALRCAQAIIEATAEIGVTVRIGVHTGECELIGDDVGGMAVHIAARIAALAGPSEVLVSGTAYGTVFGSGLEFRELGMQELRGVSSRWPIFALC
jgi:class 3 adenylate cyclase/esterase/lipase